MTPAHTRSGRVVLFAIGLIAVVAAAYARVINFGFIWDDEQHLTDNPCITGPLGLKEIWTTARAVYYPLVLTTFWIVHKFAGLAPMPFHVLNVCAHAAAAMLLWRVLCELDVRGAWIGAAIWALHPVMVQSVAWVTELKNTQSAVFYLLSILCFLKIDNARSAAWQWTRLIGSLVLFMAAVASKPSTVVLPFVLGLCLWWRDGRVRLAHLPRLIPFAAVSMIAGGWTIWEQKFHAHAIGSDWTQSFVERAIIAGRAFWFYLTKLVWPAQLTFIYPRWQVDPSQLSQYLPITAAAALLIGLWFGRDTRLRPAFVVAWYFAACLFPVLGFFTVYFFRYSFVSDHFQYLASMGPLALLGATLATAIDSIKWRPLRPVAVSVVLVVLGVLTSQQTRIYHDIFTLYQDTIAKNPACWMAHYNLGIALRERGDIDAAVTHYREAIALRPNYSEAHFNLAKILVDRGQLDEAAAHYRRVLEVEPSDAEAMNNLANTLVRLGRSEDATALYERAFAIRPAYSEAAINLADALLARGEIDGAIKYYTAGLTLSPNYAHAQYNLANALLRSGRIADAVAHYRKAVELDPRNANAHANLGSGLLRSGDVPDAVAEYRRALAVDPNNLPALTNLAWIFATSTGSSLRNGHEAIALAENANHLTGDKSAAVLRVLAAAYAENGRYAEATGAAERALQAATIEGNETIARAVEGELSLYRAGTPYRHSLP